ncbi:unnamed protein product [Gongylonema pulchrum]|uniref:Uncharacterized protein n=1 Tax=Gongylonema pulchrum TaxID=637853 RepID=A0A183CXR5_9BILA|nr:unnamed protein product [Gongylonema pulchrum]
MYMPFEKVQQYSNRRSKALVVDSAAEDNNNGTDATSAKYSNTAQLPCRRGTSNMGLPHINLLKLMRALTSDEL